MFRLNRNERSHWSGNGVHVESELVFMIGRNMHNSAKISFFISLPTDLWILPRIVSQVAPAGCLGDPKTAQERPETRSA